MESQPGDEQFLRVSDAERHEVAEALRKAAGDGRLDFDELDERLGAAFAAKTYADLAPLLADLPGVDAPGPAAGLTPRAGADVAPGVSGSAGSSGALLPAQRFDTSVSIMGSQTRRGVWQVGASHKAVTVMGSVEIDLRQAQFSEREVEINAVAIMGGVDIWVNANTHVIVDGVGIMGDFSQLRDKVPAELGPDAVTVRVKGVALMGAVNVRRKPMPGTPGRFGLPQR